MSFDLDTLSSKLPVLTRNEELVVALSGGMDSVVLLHGLKELKSQGAFPCALRAVHVNHGLQQAAQAWQSLCESLCEDWNIALVCHQVDVQLKNRDSSSGLENAAREARYEIFEELIDKSGILVMAHHRDDQMETFLLRLMRGAGSLGLSGIPAQRELAQGSLLRPLLDIDRSELQAYAAAHQLRWAQDGSNEDQSFDRNYCRHTLLPLIEKRWPAYRQSWSKAITLADEAQGLQRTLAQIDLKDAATDCGAGLKIESLLSLDEPRRRNLLRYWMTRLNLPDPGWKGLLQMSRELVCASDDSASVKTQSYALLRFKNCLFALGDSNEFVPASQQQDWQLSPQQGIELVGNGSLLASVEKAKGLSPKYARRLRISYRQGGESCCLAGRRRKSLKKILQQEQVEPWLRSRLPLLFYQAELVCIPGIGVAEGFQAQADEEGLIIQWLKPPLLLMPAGDK